MAEATSPCLVRSFSQPSSKSCEGDVMRALTSSISFGRYMSESLAWDKWSAFTHNKYREEAERYSRPGSVAEKKAFFEARYKKIAAKKSAENNDNSSDCDNANRVGSEDSTEPVKQQETDVMSVDTKGVDEVIRSSTTTKPPIKCGLPKPPPIVIIKPPPIITKKTDHSSPSSSENDATKGLAIKNHYTPRSLHASINFECGEPIKMASPMLQKIANSKFVKAITSSFEGSISQKSPIRDSVISLSDHVSPEPDSRVCMDFESAENANNVGTKEMKADEVSEVVKTNVTTQTEPTFIDKNMLRLDEMDTKDTTGESVVLDEMTTNSSTSMKTSTECRFPNPLPVKPPPSVQSKKTEHSTPISTNMYTTKGSTIKSKFTSQSINVPVNSELDEPIKASSPILQKIVNSKFIRAITNTTRENRPQKPPIAPTSYSLSEHISSEPECTRKQKSPTAHGSKTRSHTTCSSFVFRSEERAMKRKEFFEKLEQKLKEEQQLQTKAMGKRTNEPAVLSVHGTKVKPNVTANHTTKDSSINPKKKTPETQKHVPKVLENSSRPPWRLPGKFDVSKDFVGKSNMKSVSYSARLLQRQENTPPNTHHARLC